jgi:hypothetical protein
LVSPAFIPKEGGASKGSDLLNNVTTTPQQKTAPAPASAPAPANTATMPAAGDSGK